MIFVILGVFLFTSLVMFLVEIFSDRASSTTAIYQNNEFRRWWK